MGRSGVSAMMQYQITSFFKYYFIYLLFFLFLEHCKRKRIPIMSDLTVSLTAPNGRKYDQPIGLFINNEFVKSKKGEMIESINPT